jgi:hypothetical protein
LGHLLHLLGDRLPRLGDIGERRLRSCKGTEPARSFDLAMRFRGQTHFLKTLWTNRSCSIGSANRRRQGARAPRFLDFIRLFGVCP